MAAAANPQEVIARALCSVAGIDADAVTKRGTFNWHEMRTQALTIHCALFNAGLQVVPISREAQAAWDL
jgi:hypothetical protein